MELNQNSFRLKELKRSPVGAGVYAWYYQLELSDKDIRDCIESVEAVVDVSSKEEILNRFLNMRLFRYFQESPYEITLKGKMKPTYRGEAINQQAISATLLERLVNNPGKLNSLKGLLTACVPFFASPIYIGVSKNLQTRLLRHRSLIEKYKNAQSFEAEEIMREGSAGDVESKRDHSFAQEVTKLRNFTTSDLMVYTMEIGLDEEIYTDLENILNRINFPLCGRN